MQRLWIGLGSLSGLTAVAMAALAAHGLNWLEPPALQMVRDALQMHGWHALALIACGLWVQQGGRIVDWAGAAFLSGSLLFCGSVYALAIGSANVAMLAPIGGLLLMAGWALLAASVLWRQD